MSELQSIAHHARATPRKTAIVMADGASTTYAELDARINQGAHLLRALALHPGDTMAMCLGNSLSFFYVACAAARSGIRLVPISSKLTAAEIQFIVRDSGAAALVTSPAIEADHAALPAMMPDVVMLEISIEPAPGYRCWSALADGQPTGPIADEAPGTEMLYSSGTTGRPKGIRYLGLPDGSAGGVAAAILPALNRLGIGPSTVYLSPAPLYHSGPYAWAMALLRVGGTIVVMERFDAEQALRLIAQYRVTLSQWVPTHFVRLLKLPDSVRNGYDLSSLTLAVHAAAPCPVSVKQAMIDWWGPILLEYFGSSEQTALTFITSPEALERPGSVGRCTLGTLHICDDEGNPVPVGTIGQIYAEGGMRFAYHQDEEKTRQSRNALGWTTVGDLGYLDEQGYLFLTDRKSFMIITGGVNVYPQEVENLLVAHPRIEDAAVIGLPDPDLGEMVTAVVQPIDMSDATPAFAEELRNWLREHLSGVKVPKQVLFRSKLPRLPTGKMVKHRLRDELARQP